MERRVLRGEGTKPSNIKLLIEGPKGFMDILRLGALHEEYKRLKIIKIYEII